MVTTGKVGNHEGLPMDTYNNSEKDAFLNTWSLTILGVPIPLRLEHCHNNKESTETEFVCKSHIYSNIIFCDKFKAATRCN